jgi:hypothetical protein
MAGDTRVILEDLDSPIGEPDVRPTADQSVRHGLKGLVDFDVIIGDLPPNFHPAAVLQRERCNVWQFAVLPRAEAYWAATDLRSR